MGFKQISIFSETEMAPQDYKNWNIEAMLTLLKVITKEAGLDIKFEVVSEDMKEPTSVIINGGTKTIPPGKRYTLKANY